MSVMVATRRKERRNSAKETTGVTTRTSITSGVEKSRWVSQNRQYAPGTSETSVNWHSEGQNEARCTLTGSRLRVQGSLASTGQASTETVLGLILTGYDRRINTEFTRLKARVSSNDRRRKA